MNASVLLLVSVLYLVRGETSDASTTLHKCAKDSSTDVAKLVADYREFKLPEKDDDFCVIACLIKDAGIIHDGKYDLEIAYKENAELFVPESVAKADEMEKNCAAEVGTTVDEECQFTKKYLTCIVKQAKAANLKFREIPKA